MATLPKFVILAGPDEGKQFPLSGKGTFFVGRSEDNDVALSDTSVSRKHAVISFKDGAWFVRDESSRNGSFVNEIKLQPGVEQKLQKADLLRVGIYELKFDEGDVTDFDLLPPVSPKEPTLDANTEPRPPEEATEKEALDRSSSEDRQGDLIIKPQSYDTDKDELNKLRDEDYGRAPNLTSPKMGKSFFVFLIIAAAFCVIVFAVFLAIQNHNQNQTDQDNSSVQTDQNQPDATSPPLVVPNPTLPDSTPPTDSTTKVQNPNDQTQTTPPTSLTDQITPVADQATPPVDSTQTPVSNVTPTPDQTNTTPPNTLTPDTVTTTTPVPADTTQTPQTPGEFVVFLDVKTTPLPATIFFGEKRLGLTPLKEPVSVVADQTYTLYADYELRELNDIYRKKVEIKAKPDVDVVELAIDAELGVLKVLSLPRNVDFYLEGFYEYDQSKANPVKVTDIVYSKPIYLPYGRYVVELREQTQVAGSDNLITQIRYQREYVVNKDQRTLELQVNDRDLQFFPAVIKSNPSNATVYFGNEKVGTTPFSGSLPLGAHQLKIMKDGYFPYVKDVDLRTNSVYQLTAELKTSKMGELINEAKLKLRNEQVDPAINTLIEALKYGGSASEKAEVYYLLGTAYLSQKKLDDAKPYFEKARTEKSFFVKGTLGIAKVYQASKKNTEALRSVVEALVNIDSKTPRDVKDEASAVFKLISPVKSVMYITSEPSNATVYMNDKRLDQETPLILSDLGLGNYRLQFEKAGFQAYKTSQNLKVGEFVIVKIKLESEKK